MRSRRRIPVTPDMVSLWIPSGAGRVVDIIRGNDGICSGTHPNVPVIRKDLLLGSLDYDGLSGTFTVGEEINSASGAQGIIVSDDGSTLALTNCSGLFNDNEQITGSASTATANVNHPDGSVGADGHVKNGAFVDDNDPPDDWAPASGSVTLTTEANGQVGNCMKIALSGVANQGAGQTFGSLIVGKAHELIFYYKVTAGDKMRLRDDTDGVYLFDDLASTTWVKLSYKFVATATSKALSWRSKADGDIVYLDEVSLYEIDRKQLIDTSLGWHFDGTDDYVKMSHDSSLSFTSGNFTIGLWVNVTKESDVLLMCKGASDADGYYLYLAPGGVLTLVTNQSGAKQNVLANDVLVSDIWTFIVAVRNGTAGKIYVNSVDETSSSDTLTDPKTNTRSVVIGAYFDYSANIDGYIALPFIAKSAWSAAQVNNFYLATKGLFSPRG